MPTTPGACGVRSAAVSRCLTPPDQFSGTTWATTTRMKKILTHLGLPTEPLPRAQARDPTGQESFDFGAA